MTKLYTQYLFNSKERSFVPIPKLKPITKLVTLIEYVKMGLIDWLEISPAQMSAPCLDLFSVSILLLTHCTKVKKLHIPDKSWLL